MRNNLGEGKGLPENLVRKDSYLKAYMRAKPYFSLQQLTLWRGREQNRIFFTRFVYHGKQWIQSPSRDHPIHHFP